VGTTTSEHDSPVKRTRPADTRKSASSSRAHRRFVYATYNAVLPARRQLPTRRRCHPGRRGGVCRCRHALASESCGSRPIVQSALRRLGRSPAATPSVNVRLLLGLHEGERPLRYPAVLLRRQCSCPGHLYPPGREAAARTGPNAEHGSHFADAMDIRGRRPNPQHRVERLRKVLLDGTSWAHC
jgi:hypothetical protein